MPDFINKDLKRFENQLATRVQLIHGSRCPCCRHPMVKPRKRNRGSVQRRDRITVAHDRAVSFGGDETTWVYACQGCNIDQSNLSFRGWSMKLARQEDRRAPFVAELADVIDEFKKDKSRAKFARPVSRVPAEADTSSGAEHPRPQGA